MTAHDAGMLIVATVLVLVVLVGHAILVDHLIRTLERLGRIYVAQNDQIQTILSGVADDISNIKGYVGDIANQAVTLASAAESLANSLAAGGGASAADIKAATDLKTAADALAASGQKTQAAIDAATASLTALAGAGVVPVVSSISPNSGPIAGGVSVALSGEGFDGATAVNFGAVPAASFVVNSPTSLTAVSPPSAAGTVDLTVVTPSGTSAVSAADQYTSS